MNAKILHIAVSMLLIVVMQSNGQPDSCTSSIGIAYRPGGANYTPVPKYVRLFSSTSLSDSLPTYVLVGADLSVNPFTALVSLEFGLQISPIHHLNFRPHVGGGGLPIGGKRSYDVFPFLSTGAALETDILKQLYPGVTVDWFLPGLARDFTVYLRYGY